MDDTLAKDLVAMWQSELTAVAADREVRESWAAFAALWAQSANAVLTYLPHDNPTGSASTAQPAGTTPITAASQPSLDEIEQLNRRVTELEQILAKFRAGGFEQDGSGGARSGVRGNDQG